MKNTLTARLSSWAFRLSARSFTWAFRLMTSFGRNPNPMPKFRNSAP